MSAKVFITGGTGFLGSYIIKELVERGYTVRAILRRHIRVPFYLSPDIISRVEWVEGDILDVISLEDGMEGMENVIHAAARVSFRESDREIMYKVNVEGTANMINAALEKKIKRFVHISSVAALGRKENGAVINEDKKWEESRVNTHYARSKHLAEMEIWRGAAEGLNTVILNPSTILGFGDWNTSSCAVFKNVYEKFGWYGGGINGFVDVEDVAKAACRIMESHYSEERFIINGENWPFKRLLDTIAVQFGRKKPARKMNRFIFWLAFLLEKSKALFTGGKTLLSREILKVAESKIFFENGKLLNALPGFSFTPLEECIRIACEKYMGMQGDYKKIHGTGIHNKQES